MLDLDLEANLTVQDFIDRLDILEKGLPEKDYMNILQAPLLIPHFIAEEIQFHFVKRVVFAENRENSEKQAVMLFSELILAQQEKQLLKPTEQ